VDPRAGLDSVVRRNSQLLWGIEHPIIQLVAQCYTIELSRLVASVSKPNIMGIHTSREASLLSYRMAEEMLKNIKECKGEFYWVVDSHCFCSENLWNKSCWVSVASFLIHFRDISFSLVIRLWAGRPGFDSRQRLAYFSLRHRVKTDPGSHPAPYPVGTAGSPGVKWPSREADHSSPSTAGVKNA
jgi:hypothetical protein